MNMGATKEIFRGEMAGSAGFQAQQKGLKIAYKTMHVCKWGKELATSSE
jgi:hypothetical protein